MSHLADQAHAGFPVSIYYAFKQSETVDSGTSSTGWETFLAAVIGAGSRSPALGRYERRTAAACAAWPPMPLPPASFSSVGPVPATHRPQRAVNSSTPFGRSCRTRSASCKPAIFAPVDLAQAAIGPGMAVFTRYAKVIDAEGKPLSVREALELINRTLDEVLTRTGGRFRFGQPLGGRLVRAARLRRGRVRYCRNPLQGQEHQRRRLGRSRNPRIEGRHGPAPEARRTTRNLGPDHRREAYRMGDGASSRFVCWRRTAKTPQPSLLRDSAPRPKRPGSCATASTRYVSGKSAPPKHSRTTAWSGAGRRSPA